MPIFAQSDSEDGIVRIVVEDDGKKPLGNARVFLLGPNQASALTNQTGIVKYTDVPVGIYRIRVTRPGYLPVISRSFEVLGNKQVDVTVDLGVPNNPTAAASAGTGNANTSTSGLRVIGTVRARAVVSTSDVDDSSPVRRISDSLADALNTLAGVDVTTASNDPDAAQTISLHGHDESQTAVTLDGIPLGAPGTAVNLRGIGTDLFTGASASFGARAGALGGGVNFTTLQPTQSWQSRLSVADGAFDKYNWSLGETGSIGKLGIAVMTTKRGGNNPLTFQDYEDESGLTYPHGGESTSAGDLIKLRYELTDTTNVIYTALENNTDVATLCTQFTGPLPCGIGPNNVSTGKYGFDYLTVQQLAGLVAIQVTGFESSQHQLTNDLDRYIAGIPSPYSAQTSTLARGIAAQATVAKDNHTITFNAATFAAQTSFDPLVETGTSLFQTGSVNGVAASTYSLTDSIKLSDKISVGPQLSLADTTGSGSSILGGVAGSWRPNERDTFTGQMSVGSSQPAPAIVRSYSDPNSARTNCYAGTAQVSGPGDQPTKQSAIDYEATWSHAFADGAILNADVYRQSQAGQLVNAAVTAAAAGLSPTSPYYGAVVGYYSSVCPVPPFSEPNIYVSEPVNDTTRVYQGFDISGRFGLGRDFTVIPSYSTNSSFYAAADPRFTGVGSTLVLFEQLYGRPLHKANLTLDAFNPPSGLEFLANAQYAGIDNSQHLAPYVSVSLGISHPLGIGQITLFETNAFNTETGYFSTLAYAEPEPLVGAPPLLVAANPLPPRTLQLSYSFNTGARPGAGGAHIPGMRGGGRQLAQAAASPSPGPGGPRGVFGFGQLHFVEPPVGTDPLAVAVTRPECTADLQPLAQKALAQLAVAAHAFAGGATTLPAVDGVEVTPHGDAKGAWWFGLGPQIPPGLFRRPQNAQAGNGGGGRRGGFGGPGGPGGPEGPPGGFQPEVAVGPNAQTAPRPQFSPSPELIAALQPFRALVSCSYGTVLTPAEATAKGLDVGAGGPEPPPAPGASPEPRPSPSPGASPRPGEGRGRGGRGGRGFLQYAPNVGIFVVRAPELGTGGGSVKQ
ncbi:MAG TPA: TonB-dependent receptor [Candidatus Sulfotelmatobacter sp.]|nr:TonB-dependent receptor [Candidatus Sulfotelmatobacter sp.]